MNAQESKLDADNALLLLDVSINECPTGLGKATLSVIRTFVAELVANSQRLKDLGQKHVDERDAALRRVAELEKALRFVVDRENLMFAECSDAEEIIARCKQALGE